MSSSYSWPLSVDTFTLADKLKIAWWILTTKQYTMGAKVAAFEEAMSAYSGMRALAVSSGSTANQLVFELWKVKNPGITPVVIVPSVTWISSLSPAMMAGMEVVPCDVNLVDLSFDYEHLANLLDRHAARRVIIWPTALIGFVPDMERLHAMARKHGAADVYLDSCENTFSRIEGKLEDIVHYGDCPPHSILASASITTTSCYFAHQIVAIEMGFVFFRDEADYKLARMFRNHGMTRSLPPSDELRRQIEEANPEVDPQFLFGLAGTNLRPTDVHAMFGLADLKRAEAAKQHRLEVYAAYEAQLDRTLYYLPPHQAEHVAFCLPIFARDKAKVPVIKEALKMAGVETRPMVGGFLGKQPSLKHLFEMPSVYPSAEWIHEHGMYIGVHRDVTPAMVHRLTCLLNTL